MRKRRTIATILLLTFLTIFATGCGSTGAIPASAGADVKPAPQTQAQTQKIEAEQSKPQEDSNLLYISADKLKVREEAKQDAKAVDSIMKGTAVKLIEEKKDEKDMLWYKISYEADKKETTGWVNAKYTVKDRLDLLGAEFKKLDFSPQQKTFEYPDNPRVEVRGIYLTIYSASTERLDRLIAMTKRTKINTFVIDVKDDKGYMLFPTKAAEKYSPAANKKATVKDIAALMKKLKDNNIYAIARIVSFKDPTYTSLHPEKAIINRKTGKPYSNNDGLIWASAHDRTLWEYNLAVAKEAAAAGFNEIQFDYVRFPASNGGKLDKTLDYRNTKDESKPETIQNYLKYAREQLAPLHVYISADVYGLVGSVPDDMALGQYWEAVSNVVDFISPMMYPSHYANGTYGLPLPDAYPYKTILHGAKDAAARNKNIPTPSTIRPWIQDFTATWVKGHIVYSSAQVEQQIKALEENGINQYLLWNAGNKYSEGAVGK